MRVAVYVSEAMQQEAEIFKARNIAAFRAKQRGEAFVNLFAAAKQLTDNYPKRFPYLQQAVDDIELKELAPKLDRGKFGG